MTHRTMLLLCLLSVTTLASCGRDDAQPDEAAASDAAAHEAPVAEAPAAPATDDAPAPDRPLEVSDLDAYARGVAWEIETLKPKLDEVRRARAAKDDIAETAALFALATPLDDEAAKVVGMPAARYKHVRIKIDEVLGALQMGAAMKPQIEAMEQMDMSGMTEEQKEQQRRGIEEMKTAWGDPYAKLPPDVAAAMRPREAELAKLRDELLALRLGAL